MSHGESFRGIIENAVPNHGAPPRWRRTASSFLASRLVDTLWAWAAGTTTSAQEPAPRLTLRGGRAQLTGCVGGETYRADLVLVGESVADSDVVERDAAEERPLLNSLVGIAALHLFDPGFRAPRHHQLYHPAVVSATVRRLRPPRGSPDRLGPGNPGRRRHPWATSWTCRRFRSNPLPRRRIGAGHQPPLLVQVDELPGELRIAVEADSYLFHGGEQAFARDIRRYNALVAQDWAVLRVSFRDFMTGPEAVRDQVQSVVWARLSRR